MTDNQETTASQPDNNQEKKRVELNAEITVNKKQLTRKVDDKKIEVKPYDLSVKHNVIPERLMALEIVNERFARQFRIGLFNSCTTTL